MVTPWNFPIAVPAWKLAPALAYGNTVVLKPASLTPGMGVALAEVLAEAGIPPGVFNLVTGSGGVVGDALVAHPAVRGVSFTGSNAVGKRIAALALERGVRYQLEMGGKNPILIAPDADLDQAVELTVRGAMLSCGQKCTATSRAIVCQPLVEEFTTRLVKRVRELRQGPGTDASTFLGPVVSEAQRRSILEYVRIGQEEGARLLVGGGVPEGPEFAHGYYVQPTVFDQVTPSMRIAREEIFGPVLAILAAKDLQEAIAMANNTAYGLSASLVTRSLNAALEYVTDIEAGLVRVNGETAGVEPQAPFGGMKESSSYSREQGRAAMEFYTQVKTVYLERAAS
ncbi:MAG: aldehyde dehydrogenase family protein [Armatimonadota bacterium]|nr:aldehyde dehydrogenase family protein [Armatimonadota bacterium]